MKKLSAFMSESLTKNFIKEFKGVINLLPSDYEPKIKITFKEK